jgi:hypothetical protein
MIESSSVRRALSRVRDEISPTRDDKARLRARILAQAAPLAPESAGPDGVARGATVAPGAQAAARAASLGAASLGRWATLQAAGWVGAATALTLLGIGGGVGFWLGHEVASSRAQSSAAFERPAPVAEAPDRSASAPLASAAPPAPSEAADVPAAPPAASETRRVPHPADAPPRAHAARRAESSPLNDELALLRRVERALRNNDPALARALLGELDERFPDSRLGEERSAARRIADCRSGEPGASESARAFLREHGASVYRKRIVLACALDAEKGPATPAMTNPGSADTHDR